MHMSYMIPDNFRNLVLRECTIFQDMSQFLSEAVLFGRTMGSFRLKWTRGRQVTISDFDETSLMCAFMFKKIARKISVQNSKRFWRKVRLKAKGIAHIFTHESK